MNGSMGGLDRDGVDQRPQDISDCQQARRIVEKDPRHTGGNAGGDRKMRIGDQDLAAMAATGQSPEYFRMGEWSVLSLDVLSFREGDLCDVPLLMAAFAHWVDNELGDAGICGLRHDIKHCLGDRFRAKPVDLGDLLTG